MVQYSFQLVTEILVLIPVLAVKSAIISLSPGSWFVSQMATLRVTSELALLLLLVVLALLLELACVALPDLVELFVPVVLPPLPQAASERAIAPAKSSDKTFFALMSNTSLKLTISTKYIIANYAKYTI